MIRSDKQLRNNYLSKLAYNKMWMTPATRPKQYQSCIIFDWDDTILCTSFLAPYPSLIHDPNRKIPPQMKEALDLLDAAA